MKNFAFCPFEIGGEQILECVPDAQQEWSVGPTFPNTGVVRIKDGQIEIVQWYGEQPVFSAEDIEDALIANADR